MGASPVARMSSSSANSDSLTVYAVTWDYALCGKTDRLTKPQKPEYDVADAVAYLHQCVKANGGRQIQASQVEAWGAEVQQGCYS